MKKIMGIAIAENGGYISAVLKRCREKWIIVSVKVWERRNLLKLFLLYAGGGSLGIPAFWMKRSLILQQDEYVFSSGDISFGPSAQTGLYDTHLGLLENTITHAVTDDAFLCLIPLHFCDSCPNSFISIFNESDKYSVGVVVNQKLVAVFKLVLQTTEQLNGFIARIERYCKITFPEYVFPTDIFALGDVTISGTNGLKEHRIHFKRHNRKIKLAEEYKAVGVALSKIYKNAVPHFERGVISADVVRFQGMALKTALVLLASGIVLPLFFLLVNSFFTVQIELSKKKYSDLLNTNGAFQQLIRENDSLSQKILQMQASLMQQPYWGQFLAILERNISENIALDRLGSEQVEETKNNVRILLYGWTSDESKITDLIERLQLEKAISEVNLSSIEKDKHSKTLYRFKIICMLKIQEN